MKTGIVCLYIYICIMRLFIFARSQDDGFCEMTCTLSIEAELLKGPVPYKYVIFSPKMIGEDDCYEFLHSFAGYIDPDPNRCLYIDRNKFAQARGGNVLYIMHYATCSLSYSINRGVPSV